MEFPRERFSGSRNLTITEESMPVDSPLVDIPEQNRQPLTPVASFSKGSKLDLKTPAAPGAWAYTAQLMPVDSPFDIPERNSGLLTPVTSFSKRSKFEPKTPGAWLATSVGNKSIDNISLPISQTEVAKVS